MNTAEGLLQTRVIILHSTIRSITRNTTPIQMQELIHHKVATTAPADGKDPLNPTINLLLTVAAEHRHLYLLVVIPITGEGPTCTEALERKTLTQAKGRADGEVLIYQA